METKSKNKILKLYDIITNYTDINRNDDISNLDWNSLNESNMEIYIVYKFNIKETFVLKKLIYKYINNYQCELSEDAIIYLRDFISYLNKITDFELELETAELLKEVDLI
jgi:hypothetical protein